MSLSAKAPYEASFFARLYALRGWVMVLPALALLGARAYSDSPLQPWGLIGIGLGVLLRLWAGLHIGNHTNGSMAEAPVLCITGPYAFMRHPLYVANTVVACGVLVYANALPWGLALATGVAIALFYLLLAKHEEAVLSRRFGEAYAQYRRRTSILPGMKFGFNGPANANAKTKANIEANKLGGMKDLWGRQAGNIGYALFLTLMITVLAQVGLKGLN